MKVALIGSGRVGTTLADKWAKADHIIHFGRKNPNDKKAESLKEKYKDKCVMQSIAEAVSAAHVIVLAVPWGSLMDVLDNAGDLSRKIIVDATNTSVENIAQHRDFASTAELIAHWVPDGRIVKAFNTIGFNVMENTFFGGQKADGFMCGSDQKAKQLVSELVEDAGFDVRDIGDLTMAVHLENLGRFWIHISNQFKRNFAFKILER